MKLAPSFIALSILFLCQEINSFAVNQSGLFHKANSYTFPSKQSRCHIKRRRDGSPFSTESNTNNKVASSSTTTSTTSLSLTAAVTPVAAVTGIIYGGILGGALHAIAGKSTTHGRLSRRFCTTWVFLVFSKYIIFYI